MRLLILMLWLAAGPAMAQTLSFGLHGGIAKQEMAGGGPQFSLSGPSAGLSAGVETPLPGSVFVGLRYTFDAAPPRAALDSTVRWHRATGRRATSASHALLVTGRAALAETRRGTLSVQAGLGLAQTRVTLSTPTAFGSDRAVLPRIEIGLRWSDGATFAALEYFASPRQSVLMSDGSRIAHEVSGIRVGVGFTFD